MTSRFWRQLADEHASELRVHGYQYVKRVQALRYFTWRWSLDRVIGGEQGRYLFARSQWRSLLRAIFTPVTLSEATWRPTAWPRMERWLFVVATRLVWDIARRSGAQDVLDLPEPELGSPFPVHWRGRLISQDLANTALELASVEEALARRAPEHVLEIGAGYGRTAYALLSIYRDATYTIVDIEPALDISRWYLTTLFPERDLRFVNAHDEAATIEPFDLAVSISSMQEMATGEVDRYLALLDRLGQPGAVVYLKQWKRWRNPIDAIDQTINAYQLPDRWRRLFRRTARVQTAFGEVAWVKER